jgi:hypothetical protein
MALAYQINPTDRVVLITCLDRLEGREWRTCLRALAADHRLEPGFRIVVDARSVAAIADDVAIAILGGLTTWFAELGRHRWTLLAADQSGPRGLAFQARQLGVRMITDTTSPRYVSHRFGFRR